MMTILGNGNVGIGITNPGAVLTVAGGTATPVVEIHDSSGGPDYTASYGMVHLTRAADTVKAHVAFIRAGNYVWEMGFINGTNSFGMFPYNFSGTQGTPTMTWSGGNVGIGTTSPTRALHVYGGATNVGPVVFDCAVSSGFTDVAFLVRVQQASATTYCLAMFQANGGSDTRCFIRGDGNLYNTNNSYGAISDRNLKENIVPARSYMDDLNKLQVVKFSFKAEKSPVPTQLGLIAQDVSEVFPGLVDTDNDGNKNLKYSILNMMMLKTVQELSAKNAALEQSLGSLEARLAALEGAGA
jgi:hypothetical protein